MTGEGHGSGCGYRMPAQCVGEITNPEEGEKIEMSDFPNGPPTEGLSQRCTSVPYFIAVQCCAGKQTRMDSQSHASRRMQRCRSYIEAAFQSRPHGVHDRALHEREKGDCKSEEDIRKIHWKKLPLAVSFTFRNNFLPFLQRGTCVQERGRKKRRVNVMKTNWQAVTIYPSWSGGAWTWRGKTGPLLIQSSLLLHSALRFLPSILNSAEKMFLKQEALDGVVH